jgi:hypothetical protein
VEGRGASADVSRVCGCACLCGGVHLKVEWGGGGVLAGRCLRDGVHLKSGWEGGGGAVGVGGPGASADVVCRACVVECICSGGGGGASLQTCHGTVERLHVCRGPVWTHPSSIPWACGLPLQALQGHIASMQLEVDALRSELGTERCVAPAHPPLID